MGSRRYPDQDTAGELGRFGDFPRGTALAAVEVVGSIVLSGAMAIPLLALTLKLSDALTSIILKVCSILWPTVAFVYVFNSGGSVTGLCRWGRSSSPQENKLLCDSAYRLR